MIFLDPKSDMVFKKLFGDITHKNILINFVNSVLAQPGRKEIVDVTINDPHNIPETSQLKTSIVDVRCTDADGNRYILEMQMLLQKDYGARAPRLRNQAGAMLDIADVELRRAQQYYSSLGLSRQLSYREQYHKLVPVIFIGVLNFTLFDNPDYISHHVTLDRKTLKCELKLQEYHFIELEKFKKHIDNLDSILDQWTYFLKHAVSLSQVPEELETPVLKEAFQVLEQGNWSRAELEAYDRYLDAIRSSKSQLDTALERGIEKGIQQGIEKGIQQGIEQGAKENKIAIATALLDVLDCETIAQKTGLSLAEVEELKKSKI